MSAREREKVEREQALTKPLGLDGGGTSSRLQRVKVTNQPTSSTGPPLYHRAFK